MFVPFDTPKPQGDADLVEWMKEHYARYDRPNIEAAMAADAQAQSAVGRHSRVQQIQLNKFLRSQLNAHMPEARDHLGMMITGVDDNIWKASVSAILQYLASRGGFNLKAVYVQ